MTSALAHIHPRYTRSGAGARLGRFSLLNTLNPKPHPPKKVLKQKLNSAWQWLPQ